jgi:hypothetical protein
MPSVDKRKHNVLYILLKHKCCSFCFVKSTDSRGSGISSGDESALKHKCPQTDWILITTQIHKTSDICTNIHTNKTERVLTMFCLVTRQATKH